MGKLKITSFDQEGVRGGRSLEAVLSDFSNDRDVDRCIKGGRNEEEATGNDDADSTNDSETDNDQDVLHICRLSFTSTEKAMAMGRLILSRRWTKILLEKASGRFIKHVLQDAVSSARVLQVKQHQRYDGIKWNFGLDWFPNESNNLSSSCCPLEKVYFTGVRFRGGDELAFLKSLAVGLQRGAESSSSSSSSNSNATTPENRPIGLKVLELSACRFQQPDVQYPILFRGLKKACFGTLERLWMPKSPGLDDDRFEELFGEIFLTRDNDACSLRELGFSYNGCGWKGSRAIVAFLESPQSSNLKVLYLNRQQGELDLQGILRASASAISESTGGDECQLPRRTLHLNLSQNYVSSPATLREFRDLSGEENREDDPPKPNLLAGLRVDLDSMTFEVPEAAIPGNGSNRHHKSGASNRNSNSARGKGNADNNNVEVNLQKLSKEEIAKLNVACGRVKYVLGRAEAASDRADASSTSMRSNPSSSNTGGDSNGSDWFFTSIAALDCVLPDLLTILRLQDKQNTPMPHEIGTANDTHQQHPSQQNQRQYRNWLPTFLRKSVKGKIELLKPWLLSALHQGPVAVSQAPNNEDFVNDGRRPPVVIIESEQSQLKALWNEIEALHANIAYHTGNRRHKHSTENLPGETGTFRNKSKTSRRRKHGGKGLAEISMTSEDNPLVKAAYEAIPTIPTSILEPSSDSPSLSLPMKADGAKISEYLASNGTTETNKDNDPSIEIVPPVFIDTFEGLSNLRDDLFRKPPPHKLPKMVAIDSEWYFTHDGEATPPSNGYYLHSKTQARKTKNRSMSVATLQIAYVDENTVPMILRSFVIDLLSTQPGFQELAKEYVSWLFGSASCDMMILGFAFGGDLRQLRKYAGIIGNKGHRNTTNNDHLSSLAVVESRCLDIQHLLASSEELQKGRVPGLKKCAEMYFQKPLKKDDQTSDWRERPLRSSQLEYAALDAVILLVLLSQKKRGLESSRSAVEKIA